MVDYKDLRLTDILEGYWNQLRDTRAYPNETEFDPDAVRDIWSNCFLVDMIDLKENNCKYTYLGQKLIDAYGDDISQEEVNTLVVPSKQRMIEKIREAFDSGKPVRDESEFVNANHVTVKYRKIFLPLGDANGVLRYVIGGMRWKGY